MIWLLLLPAGLLLLLPVFLAGAHGQRHLYRSNPMSLLQDVEAVLGPLEAKIEAAVGPLHQKVAELESEVAAKVSELETALSDNASLLARLEQFGTIFAAETDSSLAVGIGASAARA